VSGSTSSTRPEDTGYAPERWEFDQEVTRVFEDMLGRSIPQYETMRGVVTDTASAFLRPGFTVLDIGCSRGDAIGAVYDLPATKGIRYVGLEVSYPMVEAARARFAGTDVSILEHDLRKPLPEVGPLCVTLSVLTLMFVPINYRLWILEQLAERTTAGGALILVEKVLGNAPQIDDLMNANYHRKKVDSGYTPEDVQRKRLSLEGVLVPLTSDWNDSMLRGAGWRHVDCVWRWMNFGCWVAVR
jgi:tRNA (cmo5U34)-methyltransferase